MPKGSKWSLDGQPHSKRSNHQPKILKTWPLTMTAIFSLFSLPVIYEGSTMIFTATTVPRHVALNTCIA